MFPVGPDCRGRGPVLPTPPFCCPHFLLNVTPGLTSLNVLIRVFFMAMTAVVWRCRPHHDFVSLLRCRKTKGGDDLSEGNREKEASRPTRSWWRKRSPSSLARGTVAPFRQGRQRGVPVLRTKTSTKPPAIFGITLTHSTRSRSQCGLKARKPSSVFAMSAARCMRDADGWACAMKRKALGQSSRLRNALR